MRRCAAEKILDGMFVVNTDEDIGITNRGEMGEAERARTGPRARERNARALPVGRHRRPAPAGPHYGLVTEGLCPSQLPTRPSL